METNEFVALASLIVLIILIVYLVTARGASKKITITNPDGERIELNVEIANDTAIRAKGLMGRSSLGEFEGMLFVFDSPAKHPLWMFNTTIPLEAIHISENWTVVEIMEMEPCGANPFGCPNYNPQNESKYILEVNRGFAERHGVILQKSRVELR